MTDIINNNTKNVMKKIDKQVPLYVKMNADMYRANNRLIETFIEACSNMERLIPVNIMQKDFIWMLEVQARFLSDMAMARASMFESFLRMYPQMYVYTIKHVEQVMRSWTQATEAAPHAKGTETK